MILFAVLAVVLIVSAVWVITAKKAVYSVVALLLHFAALATIYFTLSAEFLAVIQIIVYSGAVLMLFVFVIALLSSGVAPFASGRDRIPKMWLPALVIIAALLTFIGYAIGNAPPATAAAHAVHVLPVGDANAFGSVADFGRALFTTDLLPFEITAFILMVAVIGVVLLAGDAAPYVPTRKRARLVEREMREAILRAGEEQ